MDLEVGNLGSLTRMFRHFEMAFASFSEKN